MLAKIFHIVIDFALFYPARTLTHDSTIMLDFLPIGSQRWFLEKTPGKRLIRRCLGHMGLGYASRFWMLKFALRKFPIMPSQILDYGCSDGIFSLYLKKRFPEANIRAIDGDPKMIEDANAIVARNNISNISFEASAFANVTLESDAYDLITALDCIHYTPHGHDYLKNLCDSLKNDGYLIFSSPFLRSIYRDKFYYFGGEVDKDDLADLYLPKRIAETLSAQNLQILYYAEYPHPWGMVATRHQAKGGWHTYLFYPFYLLVAYITRLFPRKNGAHFIMVAQKTATKGHSIPPWLNVALCNEHKTDD